MLGGTLAPYGTLTPNSATHRIPYRFSFVEGSQHTGFIHTFRDSFAHTHAHSHTFVDGSA